MRNLYSNHNNYNEHVQEDQVIEDNSLDKENITQEEVHNTLKKLKNR